MKSKIFYFSALLLITVFFIFKNVKTETNLIQSEFESLLPLDKPDMASFRDFVMMMDPELGYIPFEKYPIARVAAKKSVQYEKNSNPILWTQVQSDMGGRTKIIVYDPNDASGKKVWAGAATGGLWYNNDISVETDWVPASDIWETMSISSICFDPNNSNIMYVGTGESETATITYRESSGRGYGIWKSIDGGNSFTQLLSTQNFAYVSDIAVRDESGASVIYTSALSGTYQGNVFQPIPSDGLYRSVDEGSSWTQVAPNIPGETDPFAISDIEISDNGTIYLGTTNNMNNLGGSCILQSTTGLVGSWTVVDEFKNAIIADTDLNIPARVILSSSKTEPNTIYAIFAAKASSQTVGGFLSTQAKYLVKTTDGGLNWNYKNMPNNYDNGKNWAYLAWHAFTLKVDPNDANTIYAGGLDVHKSTDGATTWSKVSDWKQMYYGGADDYVHGDIHEIAFKQGSSDELVISSDGGVFYTANATLAQPLFAQRNKSFSSLQFYSCTITQVGDIHYCGGLQDNGSVFYNNHPFRINDMIQGGDGAFSMFDANEPIVVTSTYNNQYFVSNYITGDHEYIGDVESGSFITTFDYDSDNNIIWANACDEFGNRADQILKLSNFFSHTSEFITVGTGATVPFSAVRLVDANTLLLGTSTGAIYKVNNINSSPNSTQIDGGNLPNAFVSSIQCSNNADTILVTLSNYGVESVWQSYNGGNFWANISGNLPDMPIRWAIYHPSNKENIMLATETGIWTTNNANEANVVWTVQNNGLANVRVDMLDIRKNDNLVLAGTHGRTMYTVNWDIETGIENISDLVNDVTIYPNPATDFIQFSNVFDNNEIICIYDLQAKLVKQVNISASKIITVDISELKSGIYFVKIDNKVTKFIKE